ncbi:MAG: RsbRD N-terminal domain-containing protein, partial [Deltaproteobacteria bacterium]|nr:RsbRD N-terminal domain-containing protein [Deltaproteobacteria bacterium]
MGEFARDRASTPAFGRRSFLSVALESGTTGALENYDARCPRGRGGRHMKHLRLAAFIDQERVEIVKEWETFARSVCPPGKPMTGHELRDHANEILTAIVADMGSHQSASSQAAKSKGHGESGPLEEIGKIHAILRIDNGFTLTHMVAEYRALRASVLRLWENQGIDPKGVTRFNEAIDEALAEAVRCFTETTEAFRDQALGVLGHDLRTPLSTIVMASSSMLEADDLDDGQQRMVSRIATNAARMTR